MFLCVCGIYLNWCASYSLLMLCLTIASLPFLGSISKLLYIIVSKPLTAYVNIPSRPIPEQTLSQSTTSQPVSEGTPVATVDVCEGGDEERTRKGMLFMHYCLSVPLSQKAMENNWCPIDLPSCIQSCFANH